MKIVNMFRGDHTILEHVDTWIFIVLTFVVTVIILWILDGFGII